MILDSLRLLGHDLDPVSLAGALRRLRGWVPEVRTVIDVGASDGRWTRICQPIFSEAAYLLIEAQAAHLPALQRLCLDVPRARFVIAAAGDREGLVYFDASDLQGGIASHQPLQGATALRLPMTTVGQQVRAYGLKPPYLLKLDTHGFEVPIFDGAREIWPPRCSHHRRYLQCCIHGREFTLS